ncbi:MAG: hypothetical protein H0W39_04895 [Sphingomonas sp.]|nr:hypothetical protein [Sphingomonas sp.]
MESEKERAEHRGIIKGLLLGTFLAIPVLWHSEVISGWLAFAGMVAVVVIGTKNNS